MKYDVTQNIPIFGTEILQDVVNGQKVPTTLGKMLTLACVNAQVKDFEQKYQIYKIASRIHAAETSADHMLELTPEDIVLLKRLLGEGPYPPIAVGAIVDLLQAK